MIRTFFINEDSGEKKYWEYTYIYIYTKIFQNGFSTVRYKCRFKGFRAAYFHNCTYVKLRELRLAGTMVIIDRVTLYLSRDM